MRARNTWGGAWVVERPALCPGVGIVDIRRAEDNRRVTPKRLKQLAANPEHIPGVYNYCDRWCERCPLTRRCLNFAMEQEQLREDFDGDDANRDLDNQKFWKVMSDNLKLVAQMLE